MQKLAFFESLVEPIFACELRSGMVVMTPKMTCFGMSRVLVLAVFNLYTPQYCECKMMLRDGDDDGDAAMILMLMMMMLVIPQTAKLRGSYLVFPNPDPRTGNGSVAPGGARWLTPGSRLQTGSRWKMRPPLRGSPSFSRSPFGPPFSKKVSSRAGPLFLSCARTLLAPISDSSFAHRFCLLGGPVFGSQVALVLNSLFVPSLVSLAGLQDGLGGLEDLSNLRTPPGRLGKLPRWAGKPQDASRTAWQAYRTA